MIGGITARERFAAVRDGGRFVTMVPEFWVPGGQFTPARGIEPVVLSVGPDGKQLAELSKIAASHQVTIRIADKLPIEHAAEAHRRIAAGGVCGKLVLMP